MPTISTATRLAMAGQMRYHACMTTTTYRTTRPIRTRHIIGALLIPPALACSAGMTTAIIQGTITAAHAPSAPTTGKISFDNPTTNTAPALIRPAAQTLSTRNFDLVHAALPKCKEEDGSGSRLPCASGPQEGVQYLALSAGRRNRKTHTKPMIYIYRDGHIERGTI
jgi:hypothetical protein